MPSKKMNHFYFLIKQYREDDFECPKLYSNPDMFFEIWKEAFISKMEEERKKKKERKIERDKIRKQMQPLMVNSHMFSHQVQTVMSLLLMDLVLRDWSWEEPSNI